LKTIIYGVNVLKDEGILIPKRSSNEKIRNKKCSKQSKGSEYKPGVFSK